MIGSTFESGVQADGLQVGGSLFLSGGTAVRGGGLVLRGAKVEGNLSMIGGNFESKVIAERRAVQFCPDRVRGRAKRVYLVGEVA